MMQSNAQVNLTIFNACNFLLKVKKILSNFVKVFAIKVRGSQNITLSTKYDK